ncbi:MAG: hypothetical protein MZU84_01675 [Sphingobacterium sp.]|nr:hypothetical protein [Sphingobacterium sp.]
MPPHRPCVRRDLPDAVFTHRDAKREALVREIAAVHAAGRPVLVGTASVRESEELAAALGAAGRPLRGPQRQERRGSRPRSSPEAGAPGRGDHLDQHGRPRHGHQARRARTRRERGQTVAALGGLYVIGTNRHESLRIDGQLRGRAGRQGDPGLDRGSSSASRTTSSSATGSTAALLPATGSSGRTAPVDDAPPAPGDRPRPAGHRGPATSTSAGRSGTTRRSSRPSGGSSPAGATPSSGASGGPGTRRGPPPARAGARRGRDGPARTEAVRAARPPGRALPSSTRAWADHLAWLADLREGIHLVCLGRKEPLQEFQKAATDAFLELEDGSAEREPTTLDGPRRRARARSTSSAEGLKGPSSTWTYLVNEDQFGWGVELLKGTNVGFAAAAAALYGPLFVLALIANRFKKERDQAYGVAR